MFFQGDDMKTEQKVKVLVLALGLTGLTACGGGANGGTGSTSSGASVQTINVPLSEQTLTTASVSGVATSASASSCFVIVPQTNGQNYTTSINSSQWWSTAQINFVVKNNCATAQAANQVPITISGAKMNGSAITSIGDVAQQGNPWMTVTSKAANGDISITMSTSACEGAYCSWAQIPASGTKTFSVNVTNGSYINSLSVTDVTIGGSPSPTPTPTPSPTPTPPSPTPTPGPTPSPTPTPPPVTTGGLDVSINSSALSSLCQSSTCSIKVNVVSPSGTALQQIAVNPVATPSQIVKYTNLLPGNYTLAVDQSSLPAGASATYAPVTGITAVYVGSTSQGSVAFSYTAPVQLGNLVVNLANVTDSANFAGLGTINGTVTDVDASKTYAFTTTLGGNYPLNNVPANHKYTVTLQGIANAQASSYYAPITKTGLTVTTGQTTSANLAYTRDTNTRTVPVTVSGDAVSAQSVRFADANAVYRFVDNTLTSGNYMFPKGQQVTATTSAPSGYTLTTTPTPLVVTDSVTSINANYAKNVTPVVTGSFDFMSPFKDYNNKVVLSVNGVTSAKSLAFTSNFQQKSGWGYCFGQQVDNLTFTTVASGSNFVTTVTPKTASVSLNLTQSCDIMGTDSGNAVVLPGVVDPLIYAVTITNADNSTTTLPINQPCASNGCKDPGNGYVNAGYYAQWSVWGRQYNPYNMPFNNINDIIYAFIGFNPATGDVKSLDASADSWGLSASSRAMLQYPYMHAHLSFGGWTNNGINTAPMFEQLASSPASMSNFAKQSVALMRKTGFSGIDIDWEWWSDYSNDVAPAKKMLAFYQVLRTELDAASKQDGKTYTLTIAVNGGADRITALQNPANPNGVSNFWAQVGQLMDHVNIMTYDYHGSWDAGSPAYFQANYDFQNVGSAKVGKDEGWSIKGSVNAYTAAGIPAKKLVVGIPLYARTMTVSSGTNGGLLQTVTGAGFGDYENGILDYKCIVNPVANPATGCGSSKPIAGVTGMTFYSSTSNVAMYNQYGSGAMQPWGYNATAGTFMSYDDQGSAVAKAKAVKSSNLGGTMYWELDGDAQNASQSIIQSVKDELSK